MVAQEAPLTENTPLLREGNDANRKLPDTLREVSWQSWIMLGGVWIGVFLAALDATMVATLQTVIASEFHKNNLSAWLGTGYLLSVAAFQGLYGRISDVVGRRNATIFSITTFTIGTLLCGIASSMEMIIFGRIIAGLGGGGLTTLSSIICSDLVSLKQRGTFQGLANCLFGGGAALGGYLGGFLSERFGFRFAFLIQVPLCLLSLAIVIWKVDIPLPFAPQSTKEKIKRIDFAGALTLVLATALLVGASSIGGNILPWSSPAIIGALIASVILFGIFGYVETRIAVSPVLPPAIIVRRTPGFSALVNFFCAAAAFGYLYTVPIYFQAVREQSSELAGLHLLPNAVGIPIGSLAAGALMARYGRYYKLTLFFCICLPLSSLSLASWGKNPATWRTWFDVFFNGLGTAGATTTTLIALLSAVQYHELAVATGLSYLARSIGQVLGVSISQAVLQDVLKVELTRRINDSDLVTEIRKDATIVPGLPEAYRTAAIDSYDIALRYTFISIAIMGGLSFLFATLIQEKPVVKETVLEAPSADAE